MIKVQPNPGKSRGDEIVRPEGVREYKAIVDGKPRSWKEYVPSCYTGEKKVPLILSLHGGSNHAADVRFAWEILAEREDFIVFYPQSLVKDKVTWNDMEEDGKPDDVAYIDWIIDKAIEKYQIDETRIYIQGQSMGDLMTSTYICRRPERIAAAAPMSGPAYGSKYLNEDGSFLRFPSCAVPLIRTHGSEDVSLPRHFSGPRPARDDKRPPKRPNSGVMWMNSPMMEKPVPTEEERERKMKLQLLANDYVWKTRNETSDLPKITVDGIYSWFVYEGPEADYIFYSVEGGHHDPYTNAAEFIWDYVFSRYRRVNGKLIRSQGCNPLRQDVGAVALADGASKAYVNNKLMDIGAQVPKCAYYVNNTYYVPAAFISKAFPSIQTTFDDNDMTACFTDGENTLQVAVGQCACVWNNRLDYENRALFIDCSLYVAISDISEKFFGWGFCMGRGAAYTGPKAKVMGYDLAYHIRRILHKERPWTVQDMIQYERDYNKEKEESLKTEGPRPERPADPHPERPEGPRHERPADPRPERPAGPRHERPEGSRPEYR